MEPKGLDELLNGDVDDTPIPDDVQEPDPTPEPVDAEPASDERPRGPDGKFISKQTGDEPQAAEPTPGNPIPDDQFKGYLTEKRKRQELEEKLATLEQQIQSQQAPPAPPPSIWEDEAGWQQHFGHQVAQQAALNAKLDMSEMLARQSNPDFEDIKGRFLEMAQANPAIVQQALSDPHPWAKAYAIAKNAVKMEELGAVDVAELEAKIREQVMAELQQGSTPVPQQVAIPPSLTGERNVGDRSGPAWSGPKSLDQYLG